MKRPIYNDNRSDYPFKRLRLRDEGKILQHGAGPDACDILGCRDVWVFQAGDGYVMHYDGAGPEGWLSCQATSRDLQYWQRSGPILPFGKAGTKDAAAACYLLPFDDGLKWHGFYLGTQHVSQEPERIPRTPYYTLKATAPSPIGPWTKHPGVVPFQPLVHTYYSDTASPGQIVKWNDEYLQFFSAACKDEKGQLLRTLSIASTEDLNGSWQIAAEPILPLEEQIENSSLYFDERTGMWYLFTNHVGIDEDGVEYTDSIWVYWSEQLKKWNPANKAVVLEGRNCTWSKRVIGLPSVVKVGHQLALFYDGLDGEGTSHCRRDIGLAWIPLPIEIKEDESLLVTNLKEEE